VVNIKYDRKGAVFIGSATANRVSTVGWGATITAAVRHVMAGLSGDYTESEIELSIQQLTKAEKDK